MWRLLYLYIEVNLQLEGWASTKKKMVLMGFNSRLPDGNVSTFVLAAVDPEVVD